MPTGKVGAYASVGFGFSRAYAGVGAYGSFKKTALWGQFFKAKLAPTEKLAPMEKLAPTEKQA
jgi:hypothetical protein